jgi:hypothetical protein
MEVSIKDLTMYEADIFIDNYLVFERFNNQYMVIEIPNKAPVIVNQGWERLK